MTAKALADARVTVVDRITRPDVKSWPAVIIEVEQCWDILADDPLAVANAEFIARKGRKVNVHLRLVLDVNHLTLADFGYSLCLRDQTSGVQVANDLRKLMESGTLTTADLQDIPGLYTQIPYGEVQ